MADSETETETAFVTIPLDDGAIVLVRAILEEERGKPVSFKEVDSMMETVLRKLVQTSKSLQKSKSIPIQDS